MRAKSDQLRASRIAKPKPPVKRLPAEQRRRDIVEKAADFFAENGLTGQTRHLAAACGISQRLLYSLFPNKAALVDEVYSYAIAGPFKAIWMVQLQDRRLPVEQRLLTFYRDYQATVLTRRWIRLFLYCALAQGGATAPGKQDDLGTAAFAPTYTDRILSSVLDTIATEALIENGLPVPDDAANRLQIAWILHGSVTHSAIRRHAYGTGGPLGVEQELTLFIGTFLSGLQEAVERLSPTSEARSTLKRA